MTGRMPTGEQAREQPAQVCRDKGLGGYGRYALTFFRSSLFVISRVNCSRRRPITSLLSPVQSGCPGCMASAT